MSYTFNLDYSNTVIDESNTPDYFVNAHPLMGGNVAGEGAVLDTLPLEVALQNARSLQYAINGTETNGVLTSSSAHNHDDNLNSAMPWCQIASWNLHTRLFQDASNPYRLGYTATGASYVDVLMVPFSVPDLTEALVVPEFWVYVSNSNTMTIGFDFYDKADLTTSIAGGEISVGPGSKDGPVVTDELGYDLSSIAGDIGYLKVKVKMSSSTAVLHQVKLRLPYRTAVSPPSVVELDTTQIAGDATPSATKLQKLYVKNVEYLRQSTFGTTFELPSRSAAHDHGEHRGNGLVRHQASLSYGPFYFSGDGSTAGGIIGIPFIDPTNDDLSTTNPRLIAQNLIQINGQIDRLRCELVSYLSGAAAPRTVDIAVSLRPINQPYDLYTTGDQLYAEATLSTASDAFVRTLLSLGYTSSISTVGEDRIFELCVWQTSNIASTETYRLCGLCVYNTGNVGQEVLTEDLSQPATETISTVRLMSGQEVTNLTTAQWARVSNQVAREILGGNQGLKRDGASDNTSKPWTRRIMEVHQHRGSYTDIDGTLVDDGAVIRRVLSAQSYIAVISNQGETTTAATVAPSLGWRLHSTGDPDDDEWIRFDTWVTIPQGLGAIDLHGAIQPSNVDPRGRLFVAVSVLPESSDTTICTSVRCGPFEASDNTTVKGGAVDELVCEVLPVESPLWANVSVRQSRGLGNWTTDALKQATRTSDYLRSNAWRVTQPIRINIAPSYTGPYCLRVRWALQTGDYTAPTGGTYDSAARLLSMLAVPSRGF